MARPHGAPRQTVPTGTPRMPEIRLPNSPLLYFVPLAVVIVLGVVLLLALLKDEEPGAAPNAIWLDTTWTYTRRSDDELIALARTLRENQIGTVYAFVSSLKDNLTWSGDVTALNRFNEVEPSVSDFVQRFRQVYPEARLYGWLEVRVDLAADGYRLDDEALHAAVAGFGRSVVSQLGFDGVLLDVKPLWSASEDLLVLVRAVRGSLGLDTPIAVVLAPDLTPPELENNPPIIAPDTLLEAEFKRRVALQADQIVVMAYQSYRDNPLDYIEWVAYQVQAYTDAIGALPAAADLIISLPLYTNSPPAHDATVETLAASLDGVNLAMMRLEEDAALLAGVAIYSDRDLTAEDWLIFRDKWLRGR